MCARFSLAPEALEARRSWALRWRRRELHVIRGSRGCRIAPASPWPSSSHLKRCSSRPSRYAWSLRRRCGPEPGWRERPGAGVGGGREAWNQLEGRGGRAAGPCCLPPAARPPRIPPIGPALPRQLGRHSLPGPRASPRARSGVSCRLRVPACKLLGWPSLASVAKRCRLVTTMLMIINGLNLNSFGGPCLLAVYSFPLSSC